MHSIAIYIACMALSMRAEIVVFSPARRASRKMLERIIEFVTLLGAGAKIIEYNQEQARIRTYTNEISIVRSFPSKVGVSQPLNRLKRAPACMHTRTHTHTHEKREGRRRRRP